MKMDEILAEIRMAFPGEKAWACAVEQHQVQIGVWDGCAL